MKKWEELKRWWNLLTFKNRRAGFYEDLAKAILDADSLKRFLKANEDHLVKYKEPRQADFYAEMAVNLNNHNGSLAGMMSTLVPHGDLLTLRAIDEGRSDQEKFEGLRWLSQTIETLNELWSMMLKAVSILGFVIPVVIGTLAAISIWFIPLFENTLSHEHWSSLSQSLYWVSYATTNWWWWILPVVLTIIYYYQHCFANWAGESRRTFEQKFKVLRIPHILYRDYVCATFLVALAALLKTNMSLTAALQALGTRATPYLRWHIDSILTNLKRNPKSITEAFDTGLLSPDLYLRLSNYANKKGFEIGLIDLATTGIKHVKKGVEKTSRNLNIVTISLVVLTIAYLYFGNLGIAYDILHYQESNMHLKTNLGK